MLVGGCIVNGTTLKYSHTKKEKDVSSENMNIGEVSREETVSLPASEEAMERWESKNEKINVALFAGVMCYEKKKGTSKRIQGKKIRGTGEWRYREAMLRAINFLEETTVLSTTSTKQCQADERRK